MMQDVRGIDGASPAAESDPAIQPIPKRWWWTKRLVPVLAVIVIASVAARLWWGAHAEAKLQAEIDAIAARGEPLRWADLAPEPLAAEDNAAVFYRLAAQSEWRTVKPSFSSEPDPSQTDEEREILRLRGLLQDSPSVAEFCRTHPEDAAAILAREETALDLCRAASNCAGVDWGIDFTRPALEATMPAVQLRDLAELLLLASMAAHQSGDNEAAVDYFLDLVAARNACESGQLIGHLVALSIDARVSDAIREIATPVASALNSSTPAKPLQALVRELLDERATRHGLIGGFVAERSSAYDTAERFRKAVFHDRSVNPFCLIAEPAVVLDEAMMLRYYTAHVQAAGEATYPAAMATLKTSLAWYDEAEHLFSLRGRAAHLLSRILLVGSGEIFKMHFGAIAQRRLAATALAIRLYELVHGRRPAKLEALVGAYLPSVPDDPFSGNGAKIRYTLAEPPVLYSIGIDGIDNGGVLDPSDYPARYDSVDLIFPLSGARQATGLASSRSARPTTRTSSDTSPAAAEENTKPAGKAPSTEPAPEQP